MSEQTAFVIKPVENCSTAEERVILAWVFEGTVTTGSIANHGALLNVTDYGIDPSTEELVYSAQLIEDFPIQIKILRIVKVIEWAFMEAGYSGAFYLEDGADAKRVTELLNTPEYQRNPSVEQPTKRSSKKRRQILLFNNRFAAQTYLRNEHSIEL